MQDAHDLAEVARVLGAILGLGSAAALDRAKLATGPSGVDLERAAGGEAAPVRSARRSGPGGSCLRVRAQAATSPAVPLLSVLPAWSPFRHATIPPRAGTSSEFCQFEQSDDARRAGAGCSTCKRAVKVLQGTEMGDYGAV
jgi:hypothetical protein